MSNNKVLKCIKNAILEDEKEYCFDKNYTSDREWLEQNDIETREEAYSKLEGWIKTATLEDIRNQYGDKYDKIIPRKG